MAKSYEKLTELELVRDMETHRQLAAAAAGELLKRAQMLPANEADKDAA